MDPSKKGWLTEFLAHRKQQFVDVNEFKKTKAGQDPEHSFYGIIQPTGLMYGYPVQELSGLDSESWEVKDKVKVLLINSLINIAELYAEREVDTADAFYDLMVEALANVCEFYESVYPEISISMTNWLGKRKDILTVAEQVLNKRVNLSLTKKSNFWLSFFYRSQLFLDVYIFGQWSHTKPDSVLQEFFKSEKEELSYNSVKVIAAAAHSNSHIEDEERALFSLFIESTNMASEKKRVAQEYFEHGIGIQDIPVDDSDPWVIRKFFLELAMLTVWSDKKVDETEEAFLLEFSESLGFSTEDLGKSMIAIEGFVLENWEHLDILQNKKNFHQLSDEYISRLSTIAQNFKTRLINDIREDRELLMLLKKGNSEPLSNDEKVIVTDRLVGIIRNIPVFSVIKLPQSFLTYTNIQKVFPREVFTAIYEE